MSNVMITFGSGGHSTEMLMLIRNAKLRNKLSSCDINKLTCVISQDDTLIEDKLRQELADGSNSSAKLEYVNLNRARKVGQSFMTAFWSFLVALFQSITLIIQHKPNLCLTNGPAISVTISLAIRTKTLSLSGKLIYHLRLTNQFYVQWPDLCTNYPRAKYKGNTNKWCFFEFLQLCLKILQDGISEVKLVVVHLRVPVDTERDAGRRGDVDDINQYGRFITHVFHLQLLMRCRPSLDHLEIHLQHCFVQITLVLFEDNKIVALQLQVQQLVITNLWFHIFQISRLVQARNCIIACKSKVVCVFCAGIAKIGAYFDRVSGKYSKGHCWLCSIGLILSVLS